jgi:hypothetical protein
MFKSRTLAILFITSIAVVLSIAVMQSSTRQAPASSAAEFKIPGLNDDVPTPRRVITKIEAGDDEFDLATVSFADYPDLDATLALCRKEDKLTVGEEVVLEIPEPNLLHTDIKPVPQFSAIRSARQEIAHQIGIDVKKIKGTPVLFANEERSAEGASTITSVTFGFELEGDKPTDKMHTITLTDHKLVEHDGKQLNQ